ncbi:DUF6383 domain-containing protein [Parabacteroides sp.]
MNRKISTLFTAGLLMAGSLCGSAWAKDVILPIAGTPVAEFESGKEYFLNLNDGTNKFLYGFDKVEAGVIVPAKPYQLDDENMIEESDIADYIWIVTETEGATETTYTLKNKATGQLLRVTAADGVILDPKDIAENEKVTSLFLFTDENGKSVKYDPEGENGLLTASLEGTSYKLVWNASGVHWDAAIASGNVEFYSVVNPELKVATELNDLYNGNGFSFATKETVEENLFSGKIYAYYLPTPLAVDDQGSLGYTDQAIPAGMYFFVNKPSSFTSYRAWQNATVLAVSSTATVEATATDRANGQGFAVKAVKISDMNLYTNNAKDEWKSQGDEISIYNACFTVNKSYVEANPYSLMLNNFRYKAKSDEDKHESKKVRLNILKHSDINHLATEKSDDPAFIFKLAASNVKKGIELLNTEAKAAVYNIRIANRQNDGVEGLFGKYLTVGAFRNSKSIPEVYLSELAAKAKVLTDLDAPAYQWVITEVTADNDVTFTNRETDEKFTAKLFPQATENVYELNVSDGDSRVYPIIVNQNTYNEEKIEAKSQLLQTLHVELIPVETVDALAGFMDVDDKTLMTMAFARDSYETSNKFYAAVDGSYQLCSGDRSHNIFVNEPSSAAQWQLLKSKNPMVIVERSFVYNNNNHVTVKAKGDVAKAYTYQLRYVTDGEEKAYCFPASVGDHVSLAPLASAPEFVIKENADGSVYLINAATLGATATIPTKFVPGTKPVVAAETYSEDLRSAQYVAPSSIYTYPAEKSLKTYLIAESPEVSYPAEEGYVYMESELGNYISMNADRDGIVVNENPFNLFLHVTDKDAVIPSFYISKGIEGSTDRAFLFHPHDSVNYYVAEGQYDKKYQWSDIHTKAIFKAGQISESRDTIATMIKGERKNVAVKADDNGTLGGLNNFKVQIVLSDDADDMYVVRSLSGEAKRYLYAVNEKLTWTYSKSQAMKFKISEGDPTSNESIADAAEGVKVIAANGVVEIQGAAGKKVSVKNVLGKPVAETVLTSDNATIAAPAGIVIVAVEGEEAVKAVVK